MAEAERAQELRQMIRHTYELESRIRDLQTTIADLRNEFERAVVTQRVELEAMMSLANDDFDDPAFGLPSNLDPVPINHPAV